MRASSIEGGKKLVTLAVLTWPSALTSRKPFVHLNAPAWMPALFFPLPECFGPVM